jgi:hypothetical protein
MATQVPLIRGEAFRAVLNGWERQPWEMNGQTGTFLQLSITKEGSIDSERITGAKDLDESTFPAVGALVEIVPGFEKVYQEARYKLKAVEVREAKVSSKV